MEKAQAILSQAITSVQLSTPSYTKIRYKQFGEDLIYYVGNMELLSGTLIALLQEPKIGEQARKLTTVFLENLKERKASLMITNDIQVASEMTRIGGTVVLLLSQGIKKANLSSILQATREGRVLILSMSVSDNSDTDSVAVIYRLQAALCYCGFVSECQGGGTYNFKNDTWGNHVMKKTHILYEYGKTIFIPPWQKGHPAQHLVIKHEYGAVDLPEDTFSFIPEALEDLV